MRVRTVRSPLRDDRHRLRGRWSCLAQRLQRPAAAALLLAALAPMAASAQAVRTLAPGTRVRVRLVEAPSSIVAEIVGTRPDTLILGRPSATVPSTIPLAVGQIARLEISDGRRQLAPYGAMLGLVVGVVGVASYNGIVQSQCFADCPPKIRSLFGGIAGAALGGIGFALIPSERWIEVSLPRR